MDEATIQHAKLYFSSVSKISFSVDQTQWLCNMQHAKVKSGWLQCMTEPIYLHGRSNRLLNKILQSTCRERDVKLWVLDMHILIIIHKNTIKEIT